LLLPAPPGGLRRRQAGGARRRPYDHHQHRAGRRALRPGGPPRGPLTPARFTFLGTAGAVASAVRDNTSIVIEAGGVAVLLDCGGSAMHRLRRLGVDPLALTHVVVTHVHVDHAYGLPSVIR